LVIDFSSDQPVATITKLDNLRIPLLNANNNPAILHIKDLKSVMQVQDVKLPELCITVDPQVTKDSYQHRTGYPLPPKYKEVALCNTTKEMRSLIGAVQYARSAIDLAPSRAGQLIGCLNDTIRRKQFAPTPAAQAALAEIKDNIKPKTFVTLTWEVRLVRQSLDVFAEEEYNPPALGSLESLWCD